MKKLQPKIGMKEFKSLILELLDKAIKRAPPQSKVGIKYKSVTYDVQDRRLEKQIVLERRYPKKVKRITIKIPNGGTYIIVNTKEALSEIRAKVKKIPVKLTESKPGKRIFKPTQEEVEEAFHFGDLQYAGDKEPAIIKGTVKDFVRPISKYVSYVKRGKNKYISNGAWIIKEEYINSAVAKEIKRIISNIDAFRKDIPGEIMKEVWPVDEGEDLEFYGMHESNFVLKTPTGGLKLFNSVYISYLRKNIPDFDMRMGNPQNTGAAFLYSGYEQIGLLMPMGGIKNFDASIPDIIDEEVFVLSGDAPQDFYEIPIRKVI